MSAIFVQDGGQLFESNYPSYSKRYIIPSDGRFTDNEWERAQIKTVPEGLIESTGILQKKRKFGANLEIINDAEEEPKLKVSTTIDSQLNTFYFKPDALDFLNSNVSTYSVFLVENSFCGLRKSYSIEPVLIEEITQKDVERAKNKAIEEMKI